jgi:hypothetical protein
MGQALRTEIALNEPPRRIRQIIYNDSIYPDSLPSRCLQASYKRDRPIQTNALVRTPSMRSTRR